MTHLLLAVMGQAKYVCAIHRFIQDLLMKTAPELLKGSGALKTDNEFKDRIDAAIASVTTPNAKELDYVRAIVETSSAEMKPLCHLLRGAAEVVGLGELAARYLDGTRFREMLLRKDGERLERLNAIVQDQGQAVPVKILMDVAAELDGRAENYDGMDAAAKRKAARDMTKLIGKVEEMRTAMDAHKDEIVSHVDDVGAKIDKIKIKGKRKSKHSIKQHEACLVCWSAAHRNEELRYATNGVITHEVAFKYFSRELARVGITTVKKFKAVLHAAQSRAYESRKRDLEAKQDAARKAKKCGTIRGMKKVTHAVLGAALSIFAVAAPCMASDASPYNLRGGGAAILSKAA